ncbi:hypothetical protein F383_15097 [Gossypium arboreum]|uniref:Uncharacterized protein n=1 Tax=Gossypium arboreum TaxID=29729 RepID=A0A0B0NF02_GOSAR|nr:hypothetical protein F383_15097 [Gossypium arboreum]
MKIKPRLTIITTTRQAQLSNNSIVMARPGYRTQGNQKY